VSRPTVTACSAARCEVAVASLDQAVKAVAEWDTTGLTVPSARFPGGVRRLNHYADYLLAIHNPDVVLAMVEDYRAGLGVDRAADDADRAAGRTVHCPTEVAWSTRDDMEALYGDVLEVWRPWTTDLTGHAVNSGHHMAEDAPDDLAALLIAHIASPTPT
jgi:haloacetate dehalogenase